MILAYSNNICMDIKGLGDSSRNLIFQVKFPNFDTIAAGTEISFSSQVWRHLLQQWLNFDASIVPLQRFCIRIFLRLFLLFEVFPKNFETSSCTRLGSKLKYQQNIRQIFVSYKKLSKNNSSDSFESIMYEWVPHAKHRFSGQKF